MNGFSPRLNVTVASIFLTETRSASRRKSVPTIETPEVLKVQSSHGPAQMLEAEGRKNESSSTCVNAGEDGCGVG